MENFNIDLAMMLAMLVAFVSYGIWINKLHGEISDLSARRIGHDIEIRRMDSHMEILDEYLSQTRGQARQLGKELDAQANAISLLNRAIEVNSREIKRKQGSKVLVTTTLGTPVWVSISELLTEITDRLNLQMQDATPAKFVKKIAARKRRG